MASTPKGLHLRKPNPNNVSSMLSITDGNPLESEVPSLDEHLDQAGPNTPSGSDVEDEGPIPFDPAIFEKLLQQECKAWQKRLRLQDWNVHVSLCRLNEMPDRNAIGAIIPQLERKDAQMKLLSPMDVPLIAENFQGNEEMNYGLTIVHELLHLHLWSFCQKPTEADLTAEEQAINAISRCIINGYASKLKPLVPRATSTPGHYL